MNDLERLMANPGENCRVQTLIKIVRAKAVDATVVRLTFSDGFTGDYDLRGLIEQDTVMTRPLSNPLFFQRCFLELGAL